MDVKRIWLGVTMAATLGLTTGFAAGPADDVRMQTIAPTVTLAGCSDDSAVYSSFCDDGCSTACRSASCDSSGCNRYDSGGEQGLLGFGLIKKSDYCFSDFISPMTNPVYFEDPRTLSEVRFIFLSNRLPGSLGGNSVQVYAMQVRAALTDRLSLIATKDGLIYTQSPILDSGYADIAAGLKYNLFRDAQAGRLVSAGMTFELPTGSSKSLQGNGNGEFHFFMTGGTRIGDRAHWISAAGLREPADTNLENRMFYWSNHLDRQIGDRPLYAFTEVNWYNYQSSANAFALPIEGGDLFNLGSPGITGNDLVTHAVGLKARPARNIEAGVAWEYPMTARKGLMDDRLTVDLIVRF